MDRASVLFRRLTDRLVPMAPEEAEFAKLFTDVWRYIKFAAANQRYMMANDRRLDFERIRQGLTLTTHGEQICPVPGSRQGRARSRTPFS